MNNHKTAGCRCQQHLLLRTQYSGSFSSMQETGHRKQKSPCGMITGAGKKKLRAGRKPSSVSPVSRDGDHLSGPLIAQRLERSTRKSRTGRPYSLAGSASLCDLAPGGVCQASPVARRPGGLLPHRFTLALAGGLLFCGTFHGVAPCPVSGPPCPAELGLSSPLSRSDHLTRSEFKEQYNGVQGPGSRVRLINKTFPTTGYWLSATCYSIFSSIALFASASASLFFSLGMY
jgi:hypothetical protein